MLLFLGIFRDNFILGTFASLSMFFGAIYSIWTYNRICFGNIKLFSKQIFKTEDVDKQDFSILFLLTFLLFLTGIYSSSILDYITINTSIIINRAVNIIEQTSI
jgi:NADH:ubiquinone oxidoreductase subunit 4 (subunit M)